MLNITLKNLTNDPHQLVFISFTPPTEVCRVKLLQIEYQYKTRHSTRHDDGWTDGRGGTVKRNW